MNLADLRKNRGLQRKFVVEKIGISSRHLNSVEAGDRNLTDGVATKLSRFYKLPKKTIFEMYREGKNYEKFRDSKKAKGNSQQNWFFSQQAKSKNQCKK